MKAPNDLRGAYIGQKRGPQAGFASCLNNSASKCSAADGDGLGMPEPNTDRAVAGEALEGRPGSQSVARAAEAARNQGYPAGSRRTNYEGQAGRGVQRQEERPEARQGVGFVHSSPWQDASLEVGGGANRLTKPAQATRCRKKDGSTLANLPAGDTPHVSLRSPVRANRTPGSVRGAPGNRCPYLDISYLTWRAAATGGLGLMGANWRCVSGSSFSASIHAAFARSSSTWAAVLSWLAICASL